MASLSARWAVRWIARWAIVLLVASLSTTASAQRLQRSSDAVRGRSGASMPRGSSSPPRAGSPRGGGSFRSSHSRGASAPSHGAEPAQPVAPPRYAPPRRTGDRPTRTWQPWGGVPWTPRSGTATTSTTDVVVVPPPAARDPLYGGSAGVRVVGRIGLAPRETITVPAGTPVGTQVTVVEEVVEEVAPRAVRGVVSFDAGYVLHGVARGTLSARLELPPFVDVVLAYAGYLEPTDAGFDAIAIGRLGLGVRIVDEDVAQLRIAASARHFQDWLGPRFGVDALLGLDVVVYEATMLSLEGSFGTLGEALTAQIRASIGVQLIPELELYAGYDHLVLQPFQAEHAAVELGGPMLGIRTTID